jgi:hypothetical protein
MSMALIMSALLAAPFGCQKEGPGERAAKEVDRAVDKVGEPRAGDSIQDAAKGSKQ